MESTPNASPHPPIDLVNGIVPEIRTALALDRVPVERAATSTAQLMSLTGRTALVTGGGGTGCGNAACQRLAEQGANIVVLDVDEEAAATAAKAIESTWGVKTLAVTADVGDAQQIADAMDRAVMTFGSLDILVNNAGGSGSIGVDGEKAKHHGRLDEMSVQDIDTIVRVNLMGVLLTTRAALEHMIPAGKGRIINISSEVGKMGMPGSAVYASCKTAIIGFTRNLAHDIGPLGLTTVAVCPGIMLNEVAMNFLRGASEVPQNFRHAFGKLTIGRMSIPDEAASVIAFLASDAGSYIHGTAISVGGGLADD